MKETENWAQAISIPNEDVVEGYYVCRQHLESLASHFRTIITHPSHSLPFLQIGRLVKVKHQTTDFGWGVILGYRKTNIIRVRSPTCFAHKLWFADAFYSPTLTLKNSYRHMKNILLTLFSTEIGRAHV